MNLEQKVMVVERKIEVIIENCLLVRQRTTRSQNHKVYWYVGLPPAVYWLTSEWWVYAQDQRKKNSF